jgi:hypothetical protein
VYMESFVRPGQYTYWRARPLFFCERDFELDSVLFGCAVTTNPSGLGGRNTVNLSIGKTTTGTMRSPYQVPAPAQLALDLTPMTNVIDFSAAGVGVGTHRFTVLSTTPSSNEVKAGNWIVLNIQAITNGGSDATFAELHFVLRGRT